MVKQFNASKVERRAIDAKALNYNQARAIYVNLQATQTLNTSNIASNESCDMSKPTADWERIGDRFYRKIQLYTSVFDQDLELENYVVAGAPLSGAVGTPKS